MRKIGIKILICVLFLQVFTFLGLSKDVGAAGATLSLSPASGTYNVGDVFSVNVVLNSGGGNGVNASDGTIKFDTGYLAVKSLSRDKSIFNLWTTEPNFSNPSGVISYSGGSPTAYKSSAGIIFSITFMALKAGEGAVSFSAASALAADGQGTNILSNTGGGKYVFGEKAPVASKPEAPKMPAAAPETSSSGLLPPMPKVESGTHPDENIWYSNNNPEFRWKLLPDVSSVSFSLDKSSTTDPGKKSEGIIEGKSFSGISEGKNYFSIKFQNKSGWGPITHRQVLIDTAPPTEFEIEIDNGGDPTNPQPKISFFTEDNNSGLKNYQINRDGEMKQISAAEYFKTPYAFPALKPGLHKLNIAVSDQAGNVASSSKEFTVEALKAPVITEMPAVINKGDELPIQGTSFYPVANIIIYIDKDGKNVKTVETKTDADGNWTYFQKNQLAKGDYYVWAKVVDSRGAESNASAKKALKVQAPSLVSAYGSWIILALIMIIFFLVFFLFYQRHQCDARRRRAVREAQELEKRLNEIFTALKEEVNELMELADKKTGFSESEKRTRDKINEALDISQEFISKEIKDVEKEIN
jgi:hypothetical protein